jgi:hypothetical protein
MTKTIEFFYGIGSRYSYLAASQVDRIERTYGCRFVWKPIASGALMDRRGGNPFRKLRLGENNDFILEPAHALEAGEIVLGAAREPSGRVGPLGPILPADIEKCGDDAD